ncbi:hypothetical protein [Candidatus Nitrososphaera evergladensis]|nr:hypothetical protein [Candidatus Nitrososphaera evergladensis]
MSQEREGKRAPPVKEIDSNTPVEEAPRTNTGVKIDDPEEIEAADEEEDKKT